MPLYEYECNQCKYKIEKIQKISDSPLQICEKCKGHLHKVISSPNIRFKGSGWYVNDYAKKDTKDDMKEETKEAKKATKDDMKGETKEAKKEEIPPAQSSDSTNVPDSSSKASSHISPDKSGSP